jgi:DNA repair exonuclease SbcCD ATPase subunit
MAKAIPNPEPSRNGSMLDPLQALREQVARAAADLPAAGHGSPWNTDDLLLQDRPSDTLAFAAHETALQPQLGGVDPIEFARLQSENSELRRYVAELEDALRAAEGAQEALEKVKEYESMLDQKTELIRELHLKVQEMEQHMRPPTPKEEELIAMSEELERERCQLQQERRQLDEDMRQLREDSQIMSEQMREMEVSMARERAELARQRTELQRLNEEIRHELDRMERDQGLTQRLEQLRQKHQELMNRRGPTPNPTRPQPARTQMSIDLDDETAQQSPPPRHGQSAEPSKKDSGLFKRFFGK